MKHYESVVFGIVVTDKGGELLPHRRLHVGRIYQRVEGIGIDAQVEFAQLRHLFHKSAEVEGAESLVYRVFLHADGASGVD